MITKQEINAVELSPTKRDFYQMWNELMDVAHGISPIWTPWATNEADPGIVLLKFLVGIADKLSGAIDMNTRETMMPSATQLESMRKLCDMLGYTMHHYIAATGDAVIGFRDTESISMEGNLGSEGIYIPRFTNLQNTDESINYVTLEGINLYPLEPSRKVPIMEGQLVQCETNNDNIVTLSQLDDNHRFFFPEKNIAENGIFVLNVDDSIEDKSWRKVDNLNTIPLGNKVFKFGYDSLNDAPYIQFSDDIGQLIEDGLRISYVRTNGVNGNIALKTLSKLVPPALWKTSDNTSITKLTTDNFSVTNNSDIVNGANPESLNDAYSNYKKTIGTFDTLVCCRDYMNKIYQLTKSETNTTPLVSNIIASDIRDDINRSHILCSMNNYGICYINESDETTTGKAKINHFDLVLYPFKTVTGTGTKTEYDNSFKYTAENSYDIERQLSLNKTVAHNIIYPEAEELVCIKNYLRLKARITTTKRVGAVEEKEILNRIYVNIFKNFNARKLDFGEEIPTNTIEKVILNADSRIKSVNLDEPILHVELLQADGTNVLDLDKLNDPTAPTILKTLYNKIVLKNVLAGRIPLFKYNTDFAPSYTETSLTYAPTATDHPPLILPVSTKPEAQIQKLKLALEINPIRISSTTTEGSAIVLDENEVIQFKAPNFKTTITYPAYVNYYLKTKQGKNTSSAAIPATFMTFSYYVSTHTKGLVGYNLWSDFATTHSAAVKLEENLDAATFAEINTKYGQVFTEEDGQYTPATTYQEGITYYSVRIAASDPTKPTSFGLFNKWLKAQTYNTGANGDHQSELKLSMGLCRSLGTATLNIPNTIGYLVDENSVKYATCTSQKASIEEYYVQMTWTKAIPTDTGNGTHTEDGLGKSAVYTGIPKDGEYQLREDDALYINYTKTNNDEKETKTVVNKVYTAADKVIIRANFELLDSATYHGSHSYSKKDGFKFTDSIKGMFTLGADQQIEIREPVTITLDESQSKLYWFFKTDDLSKNLVYFCRHESSPFGENGNEYTLQDEEYIFYTNAKETDYNYYGPGTTIKLSANTPIIYRETSNMEITLADILTYGLDANIPWVTANLSNDDGANRSISIIENMFISLTEGDQLNQLSFLDAEDDMIDGNWKKIKSASYKLSGGDVTPLPEIAVPNVYWEVSSKLDFKTGPETTQKISTTTFTTTNADTTTTTTTIKESKLIATTVAGTKYEYTTKKFNLAPTKDGVSSFVFRTNYNIQHALPEVDVEQLLNNYEEIISTYTGDSALTAFKLKVGDISMPMSTAGTNTNTLNLNNFGTNYTKYTFSNGKSFYLNINIPADNFGLIALYYTRFTSSNYYTITAYKNKTQVVGIRRYNQGTNYSTAVTVNTDGLFMLDLSSEVTKIVIELHTATTTSTKPEIVKDTIVFSDLSVIEGINPKLNYQAIEAGLDKLKQALKDIKKYDKNNRFLYNIIPNKTTAIDLNSLVDEETMSSPEAFYDKNNVANKFVISEIDSSYLSTGITLTKSSKL